MWYEVDSLFKDLKLFKRAVSDLLRELLISITGMGKQQAYGEFVMGEGEYLG